MVHCSQLENIITDGKLNKLENCLLFSKKKLKALEDRVAQLLHETDIESAKSLYVFESTDFDKIKTETAIQECNASGVFRIH